MNEKEIIKISAEIITEKWPSCYLTDWKFPPRAPLYYRRWCIKNSADLKERMLHRAVRLRAALKSVEPKTQTTNSDYATALRLLDDFVRSDNQKAWNLFGFEQYCKQRLNA